jgi:hypothetical protein
MSAVNTSAPAANTPAAAPANAKGGLLGGLTSLFAAKPANAKNAGANAKNANAGANAKNASANAGANAKNAGANANKNAGANANKNSPPALQPVEVAKSLNAPAKTRRRQRGGARGKTMRLPGPRNVLRVTGKTVGKVRNVGVYGLKKVGNGVHLVTGLIGKGTGLLGSVLRKGGKTLKNLTKRRQQTRKQ